MSRSKRARRRSKGRLSAPPDVERPRRHRRPPLPGATDMRVFGRASGAGGGGASSPSSPLAAVAGLGRAACDRLRRASAWKLAAAGVGAIVLAGAATVFALANLTPAWFAMHHTPASSAEQRRAAVATENAAISAISAPRAAGDIFRLGVGEAEANAWLAHRLRQWLDREHPGLWPDHLRAVAVDFRDGRLALGLAFGHRAAGGMGAAVDEGDGSGAGEVAAVDVGELDVCTVVLAPTPAPPGSPEGMTQTVRVTHVAFNRLQVPAGRAASLLAERLLPAAPGDPALAELLAAALRGEPLPINTTARTTGEHDARLLKADVTADRLTLTCEAMPR